MDEQQTLLGTAQQLFPGVSREVLLSVRKSLDRYQELFEFATAGVVRAGKNRKDLRKVFRSRYRVIDHQLYHKGPKDTGYILLFRTFEQVCTLLQ